MRVIFTSVFTLLLLPMTSSCQTGIDRIHTQSTFATLGDYNTKNNCILFAATLVDTVSNELINSSLRIKNAAGDEVVLEKDILLPAIGWLDSAYVLLEKGVPMRKPELFGKWQRVLVRYNIFTHHQDTLRCSWYTSSNHADKFLTSSNHFFYTIAYGSESRKTTYWVKYLVSTRESKIIKKFATGEFSILSYQYIPDTEEIVYIKGTGQKKEFIALSLSTGSEKIIKTVNSHDGIEESSTIINGKFYFIATEIRKNDSGASILGDARYFVRSLNLRTGQVSDVYKSKVEIAKISPYLENKLLLSSRELPSGHDKEDF